MSSSRRSKRPHGQLRQSQVVTTFGPGSLLDLPKHSVLIGGLEQWTGDGAEVNEPRLVEKLRNLLQIDRLHLRLPPPESDDPNAATTGIGAWKFPEWFVVQDARDSGASGGFRSRALVPMAALTGGNYVDRDRKKRPVVPVRFVRGCRAGHIGDIDWRSYVHGGSGSCHRPLSMEERGTSGDIAEIWICCDCGRDRRMIDAAHPKLGALGLCDGARPWLGPRAHESCSERNRLLVRTASNSYFPQIQSVISLPDPDEEIRNRVDQVWKFVEEVESLDDLRHERKKSKVRPVLDGLTDDAVFGEIERRRGRGPRAVPKSVKRAELEVLNAPRESIGQDRPDGDFYARTLDPSRWKAEKNRWMEPIERVVLVHRLREVVAQVGFTRFEAMAPDVQGELVMGVRRAAISREADWLPAIENRGEGIFLSFRKEAIESWLARPEVIDRGRLLILGFDAWRAERPGTTRQFFGLPYVLLHSVSHLLLTALSLECGYPASALRERVYALDGVGYGILIYTGSSDAEGTLGGLVEAGRDIARHLRRALELAELCSNDPVCAQHEPQSEHERRFLQGAACHGCILISETSCEQHNDFLDRALVVPTVGDARAAFFHFD
jgi:hypothetical protein